MVPSSTRKLCANDDKCKQATVTNCEDCSKAFCITHFTYHRRLLDEEMNIIIDEHYLLKNNLNQQIAKCDSHPLIKQIGKIKKRAKELRKNYFNQPPIKQMFYQKNFISCLKN